jgi:hypothetical protein
MGWYPVKVSSILFARPDEIKLPMGSRFPVLRLSRIPIHNRECILMSFWPLR